MKLESPPTLPVSIYGVATLALEHYLHAIHVIQQAASVELDALDVRPVR